MSDSDIEHCIRRAEALRTAAQRLEADDGWSRGFRVRHRAGQITRISLSNAEIVRRYTTEDWKKLGDAICRSTELTHIALCECAFPPLSGFPPNALESLFGDEREYHHCSRFFDEICAIESPLNSSDMAAMLPFLKTISTMRAMTFMDVGFDDQMATMLAGALDHVCVEELYLHWNSIGDAGIESLLSARNAVHLDTLKLDDNPIRERGWDSIARFLRGNDTQLTLLSIDCDAEAAQNMVESVASNSNSKMIDLGGEAQFGEIGGVMSSDIITAISQVLQNTVCDVSSVEALCQSNHRLTWIGPYTMEFLSSSDDLRKAFEINARGWGDHCNLTSFVARLRSKLRALYFTKRDFDVAPFFDLDVKLMPHILDLATRTEVHVGEMKDEIGRGEFFVTCEGNLKGIYRLIRNCHLPELFSFPSPQRANEERIVFLEELIAQLRMEHEEEIAQLRLENEELRSQLTSSSRKRSKQTRD